MDLGDCISTVVLDDEGNELATDPSFGDLRIAELEAEVARLRASMWQSIETAPKDGTEVLLLEGWYISHAQWRSVYSGGKQAWVVCGTDGTCAEYVDKPTHWMPIPEEPKRARGGSDD